MILSFFFVFVLSAKRIPHIFGLWRRLPRRIRCAMTSFLTFFVGVIDAMSSKFELVLRRRWCWTSRRKVAVTRWSTVSEAGASMKRLRGRSRAAACIGGTLSPCCQAISTFLGFFVSESLQMHCPCKNWNLVLLKFVLVIHFPIPVVNFSSQVILFSFFLCLFCARNGYHIFSACGAGHVNGSGSRWRCFSHFVCATLSLIHFIQGVVGLCCVCIESFLPGWSAVLDALAEEHLQSLLATHLAYVSGRCDASIPKTARLFSLGVCDSKCKCAGREKIWSTHAQISFVILCFKFQFWNKKVKIMILSFFFCLFRARNGYRIFSARATTTSTVQVRDGIVSQIFWFC